jgi:hypothetical protein
MLCEAAIERDEKIRNTRRVPKAMEMTMRFMINLLEVNVS